MGQGQSFLAELYDFHIKSQIFTLKCLKWWKHKMFPTMKKIQMKRNYKKKVSL